jgi:hypothetical protein
VIVVTAREQVLAAAPATAGQSGAHSSSSADGCLVLAAAGLRHIDHVTAREQVLAAAPAAAGQQAAVRTGVRCLDVVGPRIVHE